MAISNNSIIHYTKTYKALEAIIAEGFRVHYCKERLISNVYGHLEGAFPMVSFCDLPLSQIGAHVDSYGRYGIGLSKEWARKNGLNPVLYFESDSSLMHSFRSEYGRIEETLKKGEFKPEDFWILFEMLTYAKNYEADLQRGEEVIKNYRFYNEREWRYVPNPEKLGEAHVFYLIEDYLENKKAYNDLLSHLRLNFSLDDISYIIVETESDVEEIARFITYYYNKYATGSQLNRVFSKIFTTHQLLNDF